MGTKNDILLSTPDAMSTARPTRRSALSGYQSISEGTAAAAAAADDDDDDDDDVDDAEERRREEVHMEFVVRCDSSSDDPDDPHPALSRRALLASWIVASSSALLVALLLIRWYADSADSAKTTTPGVVDGPSPLRLPCEIHVDGGGFRMIQTSLGDPGAHWSGVPCARSRRRRASSAATEEEEAGAPPDGEQQRPSAMIEVDFDVRAFPDRPPILGFGGAFTEATALNFWSLNERGRETALELLFGESGLGYSLGRTHINSCDFSVKSYNFDDVEDDFDLLEFDDDVTHDVDVGMIGLMLLATETVARSFPRESASSEYGGMRIVASPWSPPPWMKSPTKDDEDGAAHAANMTGSAGPVCVRDGVGPDSKYARSWALFFDKFIKAYSNHGIDFYAVTVQNEPEFPAPWEACSYDPESQGEFIANHLGPALAESHPNTKILIFDHNKDHIVNWARHLLSHENPASKYVSGTAYHWYAGGMDRLLDGAQGAPNMHRMISELDVMNVDQGGHVLLNAEACHCPTTGYAGGDLNIAWARASRNAHTILADLAAGSNGFIEWNLILDSIGGPNHLGNLCDSPLLAVPHRAVGSDGSIPDQLDFELAGHPFGGVKGDGKTREELQAEGSPAKYLDLGIVVQPMYYHVGHITRFVRPGSWAVPAMVDGSAGGEAKSRTFRPTETDVSGGGINDLARVGIEATLWPCEGSTRQEWLLSDAGKLQVFGHDWLGASTSSCLGRSADVGLGGLMLTTCNATEGSPGIYEVVRIPDQQKVQIKLKNKNVNSKLTCLVVQPLRNNGGAYGPKGGAQVNIGGCEEPWAEWVYDPSTGEISSTVFGGEVCLTTGWPFLQVGSFDSKDAKVAVILNEAGESANYVFRNKGKTVVTASIPPHSIQTLLFD